MKLLPRHAEIYGNNFMIAGVGVSARLGGWGTAGWVS
jgi:hypothetical protein